MPLLYCWPHLLTSKEMLRVRKLSSLTIIKRYLMYSPSNLPGFLNSDDLQDMLKAGKVLEKSIARAKALSAKQIRQQNEDEGIEITPSTANNKDQDNINASSLPLPEEIKAIVVPVTSIKGKSSPASSLISSLLTPKPNLHNLKRVEDFGRSIAQSSFKFLLVLDDVLARYYLNQNQRTAVLDIFLKSLQQRRLGMGTHPNTPTFYHYGNTSNGINMGDLFEQIMNGSNGRKRIAVQPLEEFEEQDDDDVTAQIEEGADLTSSVEEEDSDLITAPESSKIKVIVKTLDGDKDVITSADHYAMSDPSALGRAIKVLTDEILAILSKKRKNPTNAENGLGVSPSSRQIRHFNTFMRKNGVLQSVTGALSRHPHHSNNLVNPTMEAKNVLKWRRRRMRGHKHKKRLRENRRKKPENKV